jgi:hypothetical protein
VDLFGGGDDMDSTWCECFAKLDGVNFVADLEERKVKAQGAQVLPDLEESKASACALSDLELRKPKDCAQVTDAVDVSSSTSTISTSANGAVDSSSCASPMSGMGSFASGMGSFASGKGLRRIPKMSQIAPVCSEQAALPVDASDISSCSESDGNESVSSGIVSDAFIEDPDRRRSLTFQYGKDMSCADLCANYQLSNAPSISTMGSDSALDKDCCASSCMTSEIGDNFSDVLSDCILTRAQCV